MLEHITPFIITYNEIDNIKRTLSTLNWAERVLVIDSFSDDGTVEYCRKQKNVEVIQRKFDDFTGQCNYALEQLNHCKWVLSLDADYVMSDALITEIKSLNLSSKFVGFEVNFSYAIDGDILSGSLYPPRIVLYQPKFAKYQQDGHTQRIIIDGDITKLQGKIIHDDRKPYARWLATQHSYAEKEKHKINTSTFASLSWTDKIRCIPGLAPLLIIPYLLFIKGFLFSGRSGYIYLKQRFQAEWILQKTLFLNH